MPDLTLAHTTLCQLETRNSNLEIEHNPEVPYALPPVRFADPVPLPPDFRYEAKEYILESKCTSVHTYVYTAITWSLIAAADLACRRCTAHERRTGERLVLRHLGAPVSLPSKFQVLIRYNVCRFAIRGQGRPWAAQRGPVSLRLSLNKMYCTIRAGADNVHMDN